MEYIEKALELIKLAGPLLGALSGVLAALIALFLLIPGEQPEKFLQQAVDLLAKISIKKKE